MNIFITTRVNHTVFSNGLLQNVLSLKDVFKKLGHDVFFVAKNSELNNYVDHESFDCPIFTPEELYLNNLHIDLLIHISWDLSCEFLKKLKSRKGNFKLIGVHYGNVLFSDLYYFNEEGYGPLDTCMVEAIWTSPHFENSIPYLKSYYNTNKVYICPYIWSPKFIQQEEENLPENLSAFYSPHRKPSCLTVEPNVSPYKSSLIPLHIYDIFKKKYSSVDFNFEKFTIACLEHLSEKTLAKRILSRTFSHLKGHLQTKGRVNLVKELASNSTHIISHQMYVGLNYLYLDAAYFNIPLIHNSHFIKDFGYYYPDFDCGIGAEKLAQSLKNHEKNQDLYKQDCENLINKYLLTNPKNIKGYQELLAAV